MYPPGLTIHPTTHAPTSPPLQGVDFASEVASAVIGNTKVIHGVQVEQGPGEDGVAVMVPVDVLIRRLDMRDSRVGKWFPRGRVSVSSGIGYCFPTVVGGRSTDVPLLTRCAAAVSLRDVSARIEMEAALRAADVAEASAQGKAAFLSTISHELRNPLNAVLGMTQVGGRGGGSWGMIVASFVLGHSWRTQPWPHDCCGSRVAADCGEHAAHGRSAGGGGQHCVGHTGGAGDPPPTSEPRPGAWAVACFFFLALGMIVRFVRPALL